MSGLGYDELCGGCSSGGSSSTSGVNTVIANDPNVGCELVHGNRADVSSLRADVTTVEADVTVTGVDGGSAEKNFESSGVGKEGNPAMSFVEAVGKKNNKSSGLQFFPLPDKSSSVISIPEELAREMSKSYNTTLFGYFLGPRIPFPVVFRAAKLAWGKFGFLNGMMNSNGTFFFKFNDVGGCLQVIEQGPLMIKGVPLFVFAWEPSQGIHKPSHSTCPLWVKLHNIPLVAFNREGVSRIASALGIPKQMDVCTADMCDNLWGRPSFAKVLVEVWAIGELKRELEVVIPNLNGGKESRVKINVEYIWEPSQCSHCCVFGHRTGSCIKADIAFKNKEKVSNKNTDGEGFTKVVAKQWRKKQGGIASTSGSNLRDQPYTKPHGIFQQTVGNEHVVPKDIPTGGVSSLEKPEGGGTLNSDVENVTLFSNCIEPEKEKEKTNEGSKDTSDNTEKGKGILRSNEELSTVHKEKERDTTKAKATPFVQSVVNSFRKPIRGVPMVLSTNRFEVLSDEDRTDELIKDTVLKEGSLLVKDPMEVVNERPPSQ